MSQNLADIAPPPTPAHVPPELVRRFDFLSGLGDRPHDVVGELAKGPRVFYTPVNSNTAATGVGAWVLARAEDIRAAFADPETFSSLGFTSMAALIGETWQLAPLESDPPAHGRYRTALLPFFLQKPVGELTPAICRRAADLIAGFAARGSCEFVEEFSTTFPTGVFLDLMGLPTEELPMFMQWEQMVIHGRDLQERAAGVRAVRDYMAGVIAARRRTPGEDIVSHLIAANVEDRPFDEQELLGMCILLYAAGLDTVPSSLTAHFRHMAENQEQQAALRADPAAIPRAVEELLRLYSPVGPFRKVTRDVEFAGVSLKAGDRVVLSTTIASRDPAEFEDASAADFARTSATRHFAFGFGIHHCIGAHLARREMAIAWEQWFRLIPQPFRVAPGAQITGHGGSVLGIDNLPLHWSA